MEINAYLLAFSTSFFLGIFFLFLVVFFSNKINFLTNRKSKRHSAKKISRFGGAAIIVSFLISIFLVPQVKFSPQHEALLFIIIFILIFGLIDDMRELSWRPQLFFQVSVAILTFIAGIRISYISNPFGGVVDFSFEGFGILIPFLFVVFWILMLINSMNWVDGLDGLSGGIAFIGSITIFLLTLKPEVNQPSIGMISLALGGSLLAFLIFNFNPAKVFAGTSGSMFMGYMMAALAIFAGAKIATTLLVMTVPLVDFFWVIKERILTGSSIFNPDQRHLHHRLLELGWSQKKISIFYYVITITVSFIALNTKSLGKFVAMVISFLFIGIIIFLINEYAKKRKPEIK